MFGNIQYNGSLGYATILTDQILVFLPNSTNSLFAIPSNQEFVFFKPKQQDRFTFLLELLNDTFEIGNESPNDFREFLSQHITLAQTEGM